MEPINNTNGHLENLYKEKFPDGTLLSNPIIKKILFRKLTKFSSICRLKSRVRIKTFQTNYDPRRLLILRWQSIETAVPLSSEKIQEMQTQSLMQLEDI